MSVVLLGSTSGSVTLQEPAVAGSTVIDLPATSGTMAVSGGTITTLTTTSGISVQGLTVGRGAGAVSTNTAVGASALPANTTGSNNTGVGAQALNLNTTASNNTAVGFQAGYSSTIGERNVALGRAAGYNNTGSYNTLLGDQAGYSLTTGTNNVFVGPSNAGYSMTTGSKNTIIGGYSGNSGGLDMRTINNVVVLSDGDGTLIMNAQKDASIALQGAITKAGIGITFPATQSASTDVNTLDDYEEGTWTPSVGGTATYFSQTGKYTKIGNMVSIYCLMRINAIGTGSTTAISGLPFTSAQRGGGGMTYWAGLSQAVDFLYPNADGTNVNFLGGTAATANATDGIAIFQGGAYVIFSATYFV